MRNGLKYAANALLALLLGEGAVSAQELVFSMQASDTCLSERAEGIDPLECIGASASLCLDATDGGYMRFGA